MTIVVPTLFVETSYIEQHGTCEKTPLFNFEGIKAGAYCKLHAEIGMINVRSKRCSRESCMTRPNFNVEGSKIPVYCKEHAQNGMVNVCSRGYLLAGSVRGAAGSSPTNAAAVCAQYTSNLLDDSVTNLDALCAVTDCRKRPQWGLDGTPPTHCLEHGPLEEGVADTLGMDRSKGAILTSASRARTRLADNADGTAAKRARLAIAVRCPRGEQASIWGNHQDRNKPMMDIFQTVVTEPSHCCDRHPCVGLLN